MVDMGSRSVRTQALLKGKYCKASCKTRMLFAEGHAKVSVGSNGSSHDAEEDGDGEAHPSVTAEVNADGTKLPVTVICNASGCRAAVITSHGDSPGNGQRDTLLLLVFLYWSEAEQLTVLCPF